jgi:hypothetical protein
MSSTNNEQSGRRSQKARISSHFTSIKRGKWWRRYGDFFAGIVGRNDDDGPPPILLVCTHAPICTTTDGTQSTSVFFCLLFWFEMHHYCAFPDHSAGYGEGRQQLDSVNQHDVIMKRLWYKPAQFVPTFSSGTASVVEVFGSHP